MKGQKNKQVNEIEKHKYFLNGRDKGDKQPITSPIIPMIRSQTIQSQSLLLSTQASIRQTLSDRV